MTLTGPMAPTPFFADEHLPVRKKRRYRNGLISTLLDALLGTLDVSHFNDDSRILCPLVPKSHGI